MSSENNFKSYIPLIQLLETGMISPRQLALAIDKNPIYVDLYDSGHLEIADEEQIDMAMQALGLYEQRLYAEHEIERVKNEFTEMVANKENYLRDFSEVLSWFGWPEQNMPPIPMAEVDNFEADLPKLKKTKLNPEGRFVKELLIKAGIKVDLLAAGNSAELKILQDLVGPKVDRSTLSNMLHRWGLREKKSRSSSK